MLIHTGDIQLIFIILHTPHTAHDSNRLLLSGKINRQAVISGYLDIGKMRCVAAQECQTLLHGKGGMFF